ncbi:MULTISPECIES: oligosaccharide flippase family protein [unclassified Alteromonas]|uniref:oligosaccharide flippase family protein n=1 Tax=unclassified Alteromonas TaxID=2614992 RepID=UPI00050965B3|nr:MULTISPECIES: oligosaccharide flippase family protein [unclassified Alteromonas]
MGVNNFLRITIMTKPLTIFMSFFGMVAISRILSPDEIGVQVLAISVVLVLSELKNMGVASLLIREKELSQSTVTKAFTVLTITSGTIAILLIVMSPFISNIFGDFRVQNSLIVVALSFFLIPAYSVTTALLSREFSFVKIETMRVTEIAVQQGIPVLLAINGVGYISLPLGILAAAIVTAVMSFIFKPSFVTFSYSVKGIKQVFKTGGVISLASMMRRIAMQFPEICLGYLSNTNSAAFYSRANGIPNFTAQAVSDFVGPVVNPYFSREHKEDGLGSAFIIANKLTQVVLIPPLIFLVFYGEQVVDLVFGQEWKVAGELLPFISVALILNFFFSYFEQLMIVSKRERLLSYVQLFYLIVTCVLAGFFVLVWTWKAIVIGIVIANAFALLLRIWILYRYFDRLLGKLLIELKKNLAILIFFTLLTYAVSSVFVKQDFSYSLITEMAVIGCGYLSLLFGFKHEIISRLFQLLGKR